MEKTKAELIEMMFKNTDNEYEVLSRGYDLPRNWYGVYARSAKGLKDGKTGELFVMLKTSTQKVGMRDLVRYETLGDKDRKAVQEHICRKGIVR